MRWFRTGGGEGGKGQAGVREVSLRDTTSSQSRMDDNGGGGGEGGREA